MVESIESSSMNFFAYYDTEMLWRNVTDYLYAGDMRIAKVYVTNGQFNTVRYYHDDILGSTRLMTTDTGSVMLTDSYQPFGQDNGTSTGSEQVPLKFTGNPVSQTTGLYYYGARWYDPSIGRFISQDPFAGSRSNPQSLNPYIYVEDSPTGATDPTGMDGCSIFSWVCSQVSSGASTAWNGLTTAGSDIQNGWNSLSPEEQQGIILAGLVALTFATGGTDLLVVGAVGFAIGAGGYTGITVATGGTPTLQGALFWGTVGFAAATAIASLPSIGPRVMSTLGLRGAAEATAETGFSATRYSDYFIKSDHLQDIAGKFVGDRLDFQSAENLIGNTLSTGQLTEVGGNFQTYEQVFGTLSGKPMGLRVIWNVLDWEVRNAYPFPV